MTRGMKEGLMSIIPTTINDGTEIMVVGMGGKTAHKNFFRNLTLLVRAPDGSETYGKYTFEKIKEISTEGGGCRTRQSGIPLTSIIAKFKQGENK